MTLRAHLRLRVRTNTTPMASEFSSAPNRFALLEIRVAVGWESSQGDLETGPRETVCKFLEF